MGGASKTKPLAGAAIILRLILRVVINADPSEGTLYGKVDGVSNIESFAP